MSKTTKEPPTGTQTIKQEQEIKVFSARIKKKKPKKYKEISNEKRAEIVRRVIDNKESAAEVARDLKLKYTTVSSIIAVYRKLGRINKIPQKHRKRKPKVIKGTKLKKEEEIKQELSIKNEENPDSVKLEDGSKRSFEKNTSNRRSLSHDLQSLKSEHDEVGSKRDLLQSPLQFQGLETMIHPSMGLRHGLQQSLGPFPSNNWARHPNLPIYNPMFMPFSPNLMYQGLTPGIFPARSQMQSFMSQPTDPFYSSSSEMSQRVLIPGSNITNKTFETRKTDKEPRTSRKTAKSKK